MITNSFLRSYFEREHMFSQCTSQLPCVWISADHAFKVSANIGSWVQGAWVKHKKSKFLRGLIRGTSFEKLKNMIQDLKRRLDCNSVKVKSIYIDNCCQWRTLLQNIFGD